MRSLGFKVVDEFSHDRARSEQRIAPGIYAIVRYFTPKQLRFSPVTGFNSYESHAQTDCDKYHPG